MRKQKTKAAPPSAPPRIQVPPIAVGVKYESPGWGGRDGHAFGDALMEAHCLNKYDLAADLTTLARIISGSVDDYEGGHIFILRYKRRTT